jgi:hypothetical protein
MGKRKPYTVLVGMYMREATMEIRMEIPIKLKTELLCDLYPRECKSVHNRDTLMFIACYSHSQIKESV